MKLAAIILALMLSSCSPNKVESMCEWGYPIAAKQCELEVKMKKERSIYCGCKGEDFDWRRDFDGCRYTHTRGHDIYLCGRIP